MAQPNIFPALRYADADAALDWLTRAFGFSEKAVYRDERGTIVHAEVRLGAGLVMFGQGDAHSGGGVYVRVDDPDAHYRRAKEAGAEIVYEPADMDYGSREYSAKDPEGNVWSFGTYDPYSQ